MQPRGDGPQAQRCGRRNSVANHHFGNFGDLWKHLPMAELLVLAHPDRHWETHAGSALYTMTPSRGRAHGIGWYLRHAPADDVLRECAYARLTRPLFETVRRHERSSFEMTVVGDMSASGASAASERPEVHPPPQVSIYPGSPWIAMAALGGCETRFVLCDLDEVSISSIRTAARHLDLNPDHLRAVRTDGIAMVADLIERLTPEEAARTFLFIDPFRPEIASSTLGINAFDLWVRAAHRGCTAVLWYGFHHEAAVAGSAPPATRLISREVRHEELHRAIRSASVAESNTNSDKEDADTARATRFWCGEMLLEAVFDPAVGDLAQLAVGIHGCGLLAANLPAGAVTRFRQIAMSLSRLYRTSSISDGIRSASGALAYQEPAVIPAGLCDNV